MELREHREHLAKLPPLVEKQKEIIRIVSKNDISWMNMLEGYSSKMKDDVFHVLVMGAFSSGKSTFINALLGEKLLPSFMLPTTAIITEICYGTEKRVVVYPRKGAWKKGDASFEIQPNIKEIKKYSTIDNSGNMNTKKEDNCIESPFEKMVIYWPLPLLEKGVMLIDSPGTNDPYNSDRIVHEYIPKADAIIYLLNGTQAYTNVDKQELNNVNSFCDSILFVATYFDIVPSDQREEFMKVIRADCLKHTTLGTEAVHFVASLDALAAKQRGDSRLFIASGYDELEKYLADYLTNNKGRDQIKTPTDGMLHINRQMDISIEKQISTAGIDKGVLSEKIVNAQRQLELSQKEGDLLCRNFENEIADIPSLAEGLARELCNDLPNHVSLEDFVPETSLPAGIGKLNPKAQKAACKKISEECAQYIKASLDSYVREWEGKTLIPSIGEQIKQAVDKVQKDITAFSVSLDQIDVSTDGSVKANSGNVGGYVAGLAVALLTGDWLTALVGPVYGAGSLGRTVAFQLGAGVILGIAALFAPITYPVMVVSAIIAGILALFTKSDHSKLNSIKRDAEKQYCKSMREPQQIEKTVKDIRDAVSDQMKQISRKFEEAVREDIAQKDRSIKDALDQMSASGEELQARVAELGAIRSVIKELDSEIAEIRKPYGI